MSSKSLDFMALVPTYVPPRGSRTPLDAFRERLNRQHNLSLGKYSCVWHIAHLVLTYLELAATYDDLHAFSVSRLNDFWMALWDFAAIKASVHPLKVYMNACQLGQGSLTMELGR